MWMSCPKADYPLATSDVVVLIFYADVRRTRSHLHVARRRSRDGATLGLSARHSMAEGRTLSDLVRMDPFGTSQKQPGRSTGEGSLQRREPIDNGFRKTILE